jgi:energy-coupling factor transporter ATP-binding protein EcfA2
MTETLTICLVGPRGSGKSSLLATATDCIVQNAHGYPAELRPTLQSISRAAFHGFDSAASRLDILDGLADDYQKLRRDFAAGGAPTEPTRLHEYFFRLTLNGEAPPALRAKAPILLRVIDAAGAVAIPDDATEAPNELREDFASKLQSAEAIILVLPLARFEDSFWVGNLARLLERLALAPDHRLKRVVVAFTQYERLFVRLGPSAFTYACDPAVALYALRRSLQAARWSDALRALQRRVAVRFIAVSAFGFVKTFQTPNIDPHGEGERRFRRKGIAGPRALSEFWRPYLTADPLLSAALDLDNAFHFGFDTIDGSPASEKRT